MRMIVGVDAGDQGPDVVRVALRYGEAMGAEVEIVHVYEPPVVYDLGGAVDVPLLERAERGAVEAQLEGVGDPDQVAVTWLTGNPARALVDIAEQREADLIVVGNRGRGELASLLLGSTSHTVIQTAPCSVLVVKVG